VNRAVHGLAGLLVEEVGANNAASGSLAGDGALAEGSATTAGLGASGPLGPGRHDAVNGASASTAILGRGKGGGASLAAELGDAGDDASSGVGTSAASLGASTVGRPGGNDAINRAGVGVALLGLEEARALVATPDRVHSDLAGAGSGTGAASLGARAESRPGGSGAVNRTGASAASYNLTEHATGLAAVGSGGHLLAGTSLEASATSDTAGRVGSPGTGLAISRASVGVAALLGLGGVAVTAVVGLGDDVAYTDSSAGTAGLGAGSPGGPFGHDAVHLFGVGDVVDHPLVFLGESNSLGVVEVHTERLGSGRVDGTSTSDHPVVRTTLERSYVSGGRGVETLGGINVDVEGVLAAGGFVSLPVGVGLARSAGILGTNVGDGPLVEFSESRGQSDGVHNVHTEAVLGGLVDGMGTSDLPVIGTTVDTGDVAGGSSETGTGGGDISVDHVLGVGDRLPAGGAGGSAASGLASVGEPGELPVVLHGEELHELATEDGVPNVHAETGGSSFVDAVDASELPVSRVTNNGGNVGRVAGELASRGVHVHVEAGGAKFSPVVPAATGGATTDGAAAGADGNSALEAGNSVGGFDLGSALGSSLESLNFSRGHALDFRNLEAAESTSLDASDEVNNVVEVGVVVDYDATLSLNKLSELGLLELAVVLKDNRVAVSVDAVNSLEVVEASHAYKVLVVLHNKSTLHVLDTLETKEVLEGSVAAHSESITVEVGTNLGDLLETSKNSKGGVASDGDATRDLASETTETHNVVKGGVLGDSEGLARSISAKGLNVLQGIHVEESRVVGDLHSASKEALERVKAVEVGELVVTVDNKAVALGIGADLFELDSLEVGKLGVLDDLHGTLDLAEENLGLDELGVVFDNYTTSLVAKSNSLENVVVLHFDGAATFDLVEVGVSERGIRLNNHVTLDNLNTVDTVNISEFLVVGDVERGTVGTLHVVERLDLTNLGKLAEIRR